MRRIAGVLCAMGVFWVWGLSGEASGQALGLKTKARYVALMDGRGGRLFYEKGADERIPPASMSKIMTLAVVFAALRAGELKLTDEVRVSENAWRKGGARSGGSTMFLEPGSKVDIRDLIRGVAVASGNDASIALAESVSGTEEAFVLRMNEYGEELGLTGSSFANSTGLSDEEHYMTARDLAILSRHVLRTYPSMYRFFEERHIVWNGIKQNNRNPLLGRGLGVDGIKTGRTKEAGYCLVASATRKGRRVILVLGGLGTAKERSQEGRRIMEWGFKSFRNYGLFEAGEEVVSAPVWHGERRRIPLVVKEEVEVTLTREARRNMKATVVYEGPLAAPIEEGTQVGVLKVEVGEGGGLQVPLYAGGSSERLGTFGRALDTLEYMFFGD